jgi:hypothetical protein
MASTDQSARAADEESPLLGERSQNAHEGENGENGEASVVGSLPVEEEPSNKKLALVMGSLWVR